MICRVWHGWTRKENAEAYNGYLNNELFPRVGKELGGRGYRGFHVLRLDGAEETEFVTMVWFDSLDSVKAFAGERYDVPVLSETARRLLSRYADRCEHYQLSGSHWQ